VKDTVRCSWRRPWDKFCAWWIGFEEQSSEAGDDWLRGPSPPPRAPPAPICWWLSWSPQASPGQGHESAQDSL
jgi:hypothetical protein